MRLAVNRVSLRVVLPLQNNPETIPAPSVFKSTHCTHSAAHKQNSSSPSSICSATRWWAMHVPEQVLFPKGLVRKLRRPLYRFELCKVQAHGACKAHAETGAHSSAQPNAI